MYNRNKKPYDDYGYNFTKPEEDLSGCSLIMYGVICLMIIFLAFFMALSV